MLIKNFYLILLFFCLSNFESVPFDECPDFKVAYVESEDVIAYTETSMTASTVLKSGRELYLWSLAIHHTPSSNKNQLILLIHHAISDGDSILRLLQVTVLLLVCCWVLPMARAKPLTSLCPSMTNTGIG